MASKGHGFLYSCKCLNVRISPLPTQDVPPDFLKATSDSEFTLTFVGDQGISMAHTQVTMRTRKLGPPTDNSRCIRSTTLTCLVCQVLVYRVKQIGPLDAECQEGPLLPSHDWVEQEILKTPSGWIEIHRDCLTGNAIRDVLTSHSYSSTFSIDVPPSAPAQISAEAADTPLFSASVQSVSSPPCPTVPPIPFFSDLRPLFPPAPFVPSHPIFSLLSDAATVRSKALRTTAEKYVAKVVENQLVEIERAEARLRQDVEGLWRNFIESISQVEKKRSSSTDGNSNRRKRISLPPGSGGSGSPAVLRDFVPVSSPPPRALSPASIPRVSSLSASLATSAFYHPRAQQERPSSRSNLTSPPPYSSGPTSDAPDSPTTNSSGSSRSFSQINGKNILLPFKRSMDESKDIATSFRYFTNLEAEMARIHQDVGDHVGEKNAVVGDNDGVPPDSNKTKQNLGGSTKIDVEHLNKAVGKVDQENAPKAKRKVTFDIKPAPTTVNGKDNVTDNEKIEEALSHYSDSEDMIFDLEDENTERIVDSEARPILPLIELPYIPVRPQRARISSNSGLPASLSSLRPASLPAPSAMRSPIRGKDSFPVQLRKTTVLRTAEPKVKDESERLYPHEEELLRLVAANTPSHRGAWRRNSKAWQLFIRRQNNKGDGQGLIQEESEEDDSRSTTLDTDDSDSDFPNERAWNAGVPASLPISIGPLKPSKPALSLASYQPKTSLSDRPGMLVPVLPVNARSVSSATLRKASYAERDRSRLMDPGTLDFASQDDEDGDESESEHELSKIDEFEGGRGRQRAFQILQARSKLPAAGMWRSLA